MSWRKQYKAAMALGKARKEISEQQRRFVPNNIRLYQNAVAARQQDRAGYQWSGITPLHGLFGSLFGN